MVVVVIDVVDWLRRLGRVGAEAERGGDFAVGGGEVGVRVRVRVGVGDLGRMVKRVAVRVCVTVARGSHVCLPFRIGFWKFEEREKGRGGARGIGS